MPNEFIPCEVDIPEHVLDYLRGRRGNRNLSDPQIVRTELERYQKLLERQAFARKRKIVTADTILSKLRKADPSVVEHQGFSIFSDTARAGPGEIVGASVENTIETMRIRTHQEFGEVTKELGPKYFGFMRRKDAQEDFMAALFGKTEGISNGIKQAANKWNKVRKKLFDKFNELGGDIQDLDNWRLPQYTNAYKLMALEAKSTYEAAKASWMSNVRNLVDLDATLQYHPGLVKSASKTPKGVAAVTPEQAQHGALDTLLSALYDTYRAGGIPPKTSLDKVTRKQLANTRQQHRLLQFKDNDAWLKYQQAYGNDDVYHTLVTHIDDMVTDIGLMTVLGPNPDNTVEAIARTIERRAGVTGRGGADKIRRVYAEMTGKHRIGNRTVADFMAGARAFEVATRLGSAPLSAMADSIFVMRTAAFNGIPQFKAITSYLKHAARLTGKAKEEELKFLQKAGLIFDYSISAARNANRYSEVTGYGLMTKLANLTVRASGLNHITQAGKQAFFMEFLTTLGDFAGKMNANPAMRKATQRYGITASDLAELTKYQYYTDVKGMRMLDPSKMPTELSHKVTGMLLSEGRYAVPEPSAAVRAAMNQGTAKGTIGGEAIRAFGLFRTFPVTVAMTHLSRGINLSGTGTKIAYLGALGGYSLMAGSMVLSIKEAAKGRYIDPRDMDGAEWSKLLMESLVQGGGYGVIGDVLQQVILGGSWSSTGDFISGPLGGDIDLAMDAAMAIFDEGTYEEFATSMTKVGEQMGQRLPIANMWYTKLAFRRAITDNLGKMADPNWSDRMYDQSERAEERGRKNIPWTTPNF